MVLFRDVAFAPTGSPAGDTEFGAAERVLAVRLPPDLVDFFATVNGGECDHQVRLPDRALPVCLSWWYALEEAIAERAELEDSYFRTELPEQFLPVAVTGGEDDPLLLDLSPGGFGNVLAWITGRPPGWHRPTEDALLWLASDLGALLAAMLVPDG